MLIAFFRTIILYLLIMAGLRLLGKRQIGELEPGELVLTFMLSDLAAVPMQDFGIPLLAGVLPICTLLALSMLTSRLSLQSLKFRQIVCGTPSTLIHEGVIQQKAMKENRYTLDELLEELREMGYCNLEEVRYAILENSGQLSVLPWTKYAPVTPQQLGLEVGEGASLPTVLVNDGRILRGNLRSVQKDDAWLSKTLAGHGLTSPKEVFLLTIDTAGTVTCIPKEPS